MTNEKNNDLQPQMQRQSIDDLLGDPFGMDLQKPTMTEPQPSVADPLQPPTVQQTQQVAPRMVDQLTAEERQKAEQIASQIPIGSNDAVITYGAGAQKELTNFSHAMLNQVQANEIGPIGDVLNDLMAKLSLLDPEELAPQQKQGFLNKLFRNAKKSINELMSKYEKLGTQVDKISVQLDHSKRGLIEDVQRLDQLYEQNKSYFQALNIYIAAAELRRDEIMEVTVPQLQAKAEASQDQMDVQEVNDMLQFVDRLDKRIHDLKLSRQITIQSAPQIRMIQQTNQTLAEKIQSSIMTAIPLWKNQIAIALTLNRQQQAVETQKLVTKTTNDLLLKNSEMLKQNTLETARENERGIVEIETLKQTQENLISTIEETLVIQSEGRQKRQQAELEIAQMENDLKTRLLNVYEQTEGRR